MTSALDQALQLKRSGRLDEAVIALEGVLGRAPQDGFALGHLAEVHLRRGRLDDAAAALDRAEAANGTTAFTARLRGDLLVKAGDYAGASRAYADAVALGETGAWSLVRLARCRIRTKDLEGARGAASEALERDPASAQAWTVLGDLALREARLDEAETMYGRAHEHAPGDRWAYAKLVEVRLRRLPEDRREREIQVLLKTTGRDNEHLLGVLARLRRETGDDDAAARAWSERAGRTGDLFAREQAGFALRRAGRLDEAAQALGSCLVDDPDNIILFRTYVRMQHERGALEDLRATLAAALERASARRRGAYLGQLRKLPAPDDSDGAGAGDGPGDSVEPGTAGGR
jgi:tetratricopeptide (TPR) repeat protein